MTVHQPLNAKVNPPFTARLQSCRARRDWETVLNVRSQAERVAELARSRAPADRAELLLAIAELCDQAESVGALDRDSVEEALSSVLLLLTGQVERDIRRLLSSRLAHAVWAPRALVNLLALDDIDIARPVIASSPVLEDADLVQILIKATLEHQIAVASRPQIGPPVVDVILDQQQPRVMAALAGNVTAQISEEALGRLVEAAQQAAALREPLTWHPALLPDQARQLYAWVGESLRTALRSRFRLDPGPLDAALAGAVDDAFRGQPQQSTAPAPRVDPGRDEVERRLIEKLHGAGQLRSGYLLRALREGKLSLFESAMAKLGGFQLAQVRRATRARSPELLALACTAVGVDRSVFPTVLSLVRDLNQGRPMGEASAGLRAAEAFSAHPAERAAAAFRQTAPV